MPRPTRRRTLCAIALLAIAGGSFAVWHFTRSSPQPVALPPQITPDGVDPLVVGAIDAARQKVLDDPRSAAAWGELGKLLSAHTFDSVADACFEEAEKLDQNDGRWPYHRGHHAMASDAAVAIAHFRRAAAGRQPNPAYSSAARLRLAEALLERQELDEAADLFSAELGNEADSIRTRAVYGLGLVAVARDDLDTARRHLAAVAQSPFARRKASAQLARIARLRNDTSAADRYEEEATRPQPDRAWPDPFVAETNRLRVGQQETLQKADALVRRGKPAEAAEILVSLSRDYPNEQTFQATGAVLIQLSDYAQAEQMLRTCLAFDPTHPQAHHLLAMSLVLHGESLSTKGEREQAREMFRAAAEHGRRATERKPDFASAFIHRGRALLHLGERDEAITSLKKAVECRPEIADGHLYLGEALAEAGRLDEARNSLNTAKQLADPGDPRPDAALAKLGPQHRK